MISAIILTKDEEENIIDCLETLKFCGEIIIVDDYSNDRTVELVEKLNNKKIKIYKHHLEDNFSSQRNFGLKEVSGNWILYVDADERVSENLKMEIENLDNPNLSSRFQGYYLKRSDFMWGKKLKHGEMGNIKLLRLAKRNSGLWKGKVHERWEIKGPLSELKNQLFHYPHQNIAEFLREINFYTTLRARELFDKGVKTSFCKIIFYPSVKFIQNYIIKSGFRDGIEGLIFAIFMSFHSFLVRGKLWLLSSSK